MLGKTFKITNNCIILATPLIVFMTLLGLYVSYAGFAADDPYKFRSNFPDMDFLSVEMEAYGLFYIAQKLGKKAACLMTAVDSLYDEKSLTSEERETSLNTMIELALDSVINK